MAEKKRLQYIDMAKGLGILMVTYGHITSLEPPIDQWMSMFKITIFYVVAGYMIAMQNRWRETSFGTYCRKLGRSIMIPYLSFSVIITFVLSAARFLKHKTVQETFVHAVYESVSLVGVRTLWFLPSLFFGELFLILLLKSKSKAVVGASLIWPIPVSLFFRDLFPRLADALSENRYYYLSKPLLTFSRSIVALWFLVVGYVGYFLLKKLTSPAARAALGVALTVLTMWISTFESHINFNAMRLGNHPLYFFLGGVIGSFGAMLLFECLERYWKFPILTYFGRNSLVLMAAQRAFLILAIAANGWEKTVMVEETANVFYYIHTGMILAYTLLMAYAIIELINRHAPFLIGKTKPKA